MGNRWGRRYPLGLEGELGVSQLGTPRCRVPVVLSSLRAAAWRGRAPGGGRQGGHSSFPAPGRCRASRPRVSLPAARRSSRSPGRRHVFRGQRERLAAPGGAAQAGGRRGEDQGEAGAWPRARRPPAPAPSRPVPPSAGLRGAGRSRAEGCGADPGAGRGA